METKSVSNWDYALLVFGVLMIVVAAFLMIDGHVLGERTTGIATVLGIVGIGIFSTSRRKQKLKNSRNGVENH